MHLEFNVKQIVSEILNIVGATHNFLQIFFF